MGEMRTRLSRKTPQHAPPPAGQPAAARPAAGAAAGQAAPAQQADPDIEMDLDQLFEDAQNLLGEAQVDQEVLDQAKEAMRKRLATASAGGAKRIRLAPQRV